MNGTLPAMFKVLHSSAGAGKTHALVKHYLLLALQEKEPGAYAQVLALTFTNKAAAEMRERVLAYLEALASGAPLAGAEADVRDSIMRDAGLDAQLLHRRAQAMLTHMLHHWSQVAISTIDSFTRRVVLPFARDLQLDQELRMTTEEQYYRAKAVDLVLEEAGDEPALTKVLVATCEQLLEDEQRWRPDLPLLELSGQLSKENALEHLAKLRDMGSEQFLGSYQALRQRANAFRDRMRNLGAKAYEAVRGAGLNDEDLAYKKKGFIGFLRKLQSFDDWAEPGPHTMKAVESGKWHSGSASPAAIEALDRLAPMLRATVEEVLASMDAMRDHLLATAILRELLATATLSSIDRRLEELKREEGISFFSDLTRKVMSIVQHEPAPFLYERMGEKYRHFLIDEFQDTSLMQWHAMLPLAENALASGGSVLLVGDAKQAIYRWRNGEARQFIEFPKVYRKDMLVRGEAYESALQRAAADIPRLAANRRSARSIITFNNEVAGVLKHTLDEQGRKVYEAHEQLVAREEEGYVEISCYGKEPGEGPAPPWMLMEQAVEDSLADGYSPGDIAVLVRTKAQGAEASEHLAAKGWRVVSPDGLTLGANGGTRAVMHVLAWLHRPTDEHAAPAAQSIASLESPEGPVDPFSGGSGPRERMQRWRSAHPRISARLPLVTLVCRIADALGLHPATDACIMGLVNEAHAFNASNGDDLAGFLAYWERVASGHPVGGTPSRDAIQVMTVHKAKGLQFPVVIVPEAGKSSRGGKGERIWITPPPRLQAPPSAVVKHTTLLDNLGLDELVQEEQLSRLDELDVLYVAFTRPELRLYISVPSAGNDFLAKGLREHLGIGADDRWTAGKRAPRPPRREAASSAARFTLSPPRSPGERELAIRREAPETWDPADPDPFRSHGRAVHAVLARVRTAGDLPTAIALEQANWGLSTAACEAMETQLGLLLGKPGLAAFFKPGLEVHAEVSLLDAKGQAVRPDRIVRDGDHLRILDIKTGRPAEHHHDQVRGYMALLAEVEGLPVQGYLLYVGDGELVEVRA